MALNPVGHRFNSSQWWYGKDTNTGQQAPFNKPFYVILNLAMGGKFPCGSATGGFTPYADSDCVNGIYEPTDFTAQYNYYVDYVRVYNMQLPIDLAYL